MPGSPAPGSSQGPGGLTVIMQPDPASSARALAAEHRASIVTGGHATTQALDRLLDRTTTLAGHPFETDGTASTQSPTTAEPPTPSSPRRPNQVELERLAERMRRADGLRDRTQRRVAHDLSNSLSSSLVIHPDALRVAAAELTAAIAATAQSRSGRPPSTRRARTARVGSVGVAGVTATAVGLVVAWPAGVAVAGVGAVGAFARHRSARRNARSHLPELEAAEGLARRRWERLAGVGADPATIDAVVRRHDAQTDLVAGLLSHHPAVRAAQRMADERRQDWVEAWQMAVGDPLLDARPAPSTQAAEEAVTTIAVAGSSTALVVVSPYDGLSEPEAHALHDRLLALPCEVEVIVVLGTDVLDGAAEVTDGDATEAGSALTADDADDDNHHERIIDLTRRSASSAAEPSMPASGSGPQRDTARHSAGAHSG